METTRALVYNKDMFKKASLVDENGEANPPVTIAEMVEYAKILTNDENKEYGIVLLIKWGEGWYHSDIWNLMMNYSGNEGYDYKTGEWSFEAIAPIAQACLDIKADGSYYPGAEGLDNDAARARFAEGNIGSPENKRKGNLLHQQGFCRKSWRRKTYGGLQVTKPLQNFMKMVWKFLLIMKFSRMLRLRIRRKTGLNLQICFL